ncbi:class I SAM-dependent methyltransferase [Psychrobium sp. MM17-31]|uniref:methyltransferase domain-containing protein n=1 Tax=Psychrobium sp. MM17-31 TaxID=2917758 RepID=UPI001EF57FA4|nr:class I SAM-dependent methyltransferase [Psychrobium sp. MM17-31]
MFFKPAFSNNRVLAPSHWQELAQGEWVKDNIEQAISPWLSHIFGYHLLKVGALSHQLNTENCLIKHQVGIAPERGASVVADLSRLPFLESSVDASILALSLNFHHNPHQLLREINRVTVAGGHVLIIGINPFSPLGLMSINPQLSHKYPYNARLYSQARVQDWLAVLGFKVVASQKLIYSSLLTKPHYTKYAQSFLSHNIPGLGSFYCIMAKKLVRPLTPVKPRWGVTSSPVLNPVTTMQGSSNRSGRKLDD